MTEQQMTDERLAAIRDRSDAATGTEWHWFGNTATRHLGLGYWRPGWGRCTIMDFTRWGMQGAQPRFSDENAFMSDAADKAVWEVNRKARHATDPSLYRHDVVGIRHPDAVFIEHSRADVLALLAEVDRLRAELEPSDAREEDYCAHTRLAKLYLAERDEARAELTRSRAAGGALLRERNTWARQLADAQDDARSAREEAEQHRMRLRDLEHERDLLTTRLELLALASDDGTEREHNGHAPHEGEAECPGCWAASIRDVLRGAA